MVKTAALAFTEMEMDDGSKIADDGAFGNDIYTTGMGAVQTPHITGVEVYTHCTTDTPLSVYCRTASQYSSRKGHFRRFEPYKAI